MAKEEDLEKDEQGEEEGSEEESSDASSSDESEAAEKDETAEEKADEQGEESQDDAEEEKVEAKEESDEGNDEEETEQDEAKEEEEEGETWTPPTQLGHKRFVYAAYLAGGIVIAFVATKIVDLAWTRLGQWKPDFGEPRDEIVAPLAAVIGALVALRYWRDQKVRKLAEEVAEELTKVTWPSRKEVTNSTTVVILATAFATIFFFLMDKFWSFVTNLVYGS